MSRSERLALASVFVVALSVRLLFVWGQAAHDPLFDQPMMDERIHHEWAQRIASGEGMGDTPYFRAPLYSLVLGAVYAITGPHVIAGRLLGCLLGAMSCLVLARLGTIVAGSTVGITAGWLAAIYWPLVYFDTQLLTVGLEVLLDLVLLLALLVGRRARSSTLLVVTGVVWGLSAITRPNILALAPVIAAWFLFDDSGRRDWRRALRASLLVGLGAAMAILPVTVRNGVVGGEWVLIATNGGVNFYIGNNPDSDGMTAIVPGTRKGWQGGYEDTHRIAADALGREPSESEVSAYWTRRAVDWITDEPGAWAKLTLHKFRLFWSPFEIGNNRSIRLVAQQSPSVRPTLWLGFPLVAALAAAGLVVERRRWRSWVLPLAFAAVYMTTVVAFFSNARYRLPVIAILLILAAAGLLGLGRAIAERRRRDFAAALGAAAVAALFVVTNPPPAAAFHRVNEANHWMQLGHFYQAAPPSGAGNDVLATQCFRRVTELRPRSIEARMALAAALARQGLNTQAIAEWTVATEQHPERLAPRLALARGMARTGDFQGALDHFGAAVDSHPDSAAAHQGLGCTLVALGRPVDALLHLRRALALEPDSPIARQCLAQAMTAGPHQP